MNMLGKNLTFVEDMLGGSDLYKQRRIEEEKLAKRWERTGLLEGLNTPQERLGMARLLDNQARELITEASRTGTTAGSEEWSGVALPLVRKVFGEIAAKEFVSVQPMNLPSGLVFWLEFNYGTNQTANFTAGESLYGITETGSDAVGGLYGAGRFGYSINETSSVSASSAVQTTASWKDANFDPDISQSFVNGLMAEVSILTGSAPGYIVSNCDYEGVRAWTISGSNIQEFYPSYTTWTGGGKGNTVTFLVKKTVADNQGIFGVEVTYHRQPTDITRGDFEQTSFTTSDDIGIPELDIDLRSEPIVAKTRRLKAVWTPELAQDLNAYHSVDAEVELTSILSEYVSMEIDLEILEMLIKNAKTTEWWSARVGYEYNGTGTGAPAWTQDGANVSYYTKNTWYQTLGIKLQKVSNAIHQKTLRGGANFLVCSPQVSTIIESIPGYTADTNGDKWSYAMGVQKVGTFNNRFTVWKNPYMLEDTILVGFRGSQFLECGAAYCPYIPLIMTPLVYDPTNFTPRKGVMTRYAKKMIRSEFYGKIHVAGMNYL